MARAPQRTRDELVKLLADQRAALAASCENFDRGNEWEAPRLATVIFTLLHDGGGITSLLTQLGLHASLRLISSGRYKDDPNIISSSPPLVILRADVTGVRFIPAFGNGSMPKIELQFERWWAKEQIYREMGFNSPSLTRRRLVFSMRHQDGGGHVGELTDRAYVKFKTGGGWFGGVGGPPKPLDTAASATMRQIGWEVIESLKNLGDV